MKNLHKALLAGMAVVIIAPAFGVESVYLDSVPVTNPGEYLAPSDFYMRVPPPSIPSGVAVTLAPATVFDVNMTRSFNTVGSPGSSDSYALSNETAKDPSHNKLKVLIKAGLDNASDVPLAVFRDHFAESDDIELVAEDDAHDVLVEVETMKPAGSATVFVVINAYKEVDKQSLIFYNNFGYMGELKLLSGSSTCATSLEQALAAEAEQLHQ